LFRLGGAILGQKRCADAESLLAGATAFRVWTYARAWLTAALADRPANS